MKTTDPQDELLDVVDEDDNVIRQATRGECHKNKLRHRTAGSFVFDKDWNILIMERSATKDMEPLHWEIGVGGHVDAGESYEHTAKREIKEELGIEVEPILIKKFLKDLKIEREMSCQFYAVIDEEIKINREEIRQIMFVTKEELDEMVESEKFTEDTTYLQNILEDFLQDKGVLME